MEINDHPCMHDSGRKEQADGNFYADTLFQFCSHHVRQKKGPDKDKRGDLKQQPPSRVGERGDLNEGVTLLADRKQKKKIMSNYLVIRALLSTTEGKLSDGECHPLLSVNTV